MEPVFRVDHSGNATTDQANVSAAIASANALTRGGMVYLPGGLFTLSGGFTLNSDVSLCGDGRGQTQINHTGNNVLFTCASGGGGFRGIISNIQLWSTQGASGTAASAIQIRNHYAQGVSNVEVGNYQANFAIDIHNDVTYAEGVTLRDVRWLKNGVHLRIRKSGTGTKSVSDLRILGNSVMNINLTPTEMTAAGLTEQIGIQLQAGMQWYAGTCELKIMNERSTAVSIDMEASADAGNPTEIIDTLFNLFIEGWTTQDAGDAGIGLRTAATNCRIRIPGYIRMGAVPDALNHDIGSDHQCMIDDEMGGTRYRGNADLTLTYIDPTTNVFNTALTAARTVTLPTDRLLPNHSYNIVRPASGAFNLNVVSDAAPGVTIKALAANQAAKFRYRWGTGWVMETSWALI